MRRITLSVGLLTAVTLGGCAAPQFQDPTARAQAMAAFQAGTSTMSCGTGIDCMVKWNLMRPSITRLVQAQRWNDVAESVLATGYDIDLSWYYLGLAAANLNDVEPARLYFDTAVKRAVMGGMFSCMAGGQSACDGIALPDDANTAMASLPPPVVAEAEPEQAPAPVHHHHRKPTHPAATSTASNWVAPVSGGGAGQAGSTASASSGSSGSGWVAPAGSPATTGSNP